MARAGRLRPPPFSEKAFYLEEFHGQTLAVCGPPETLVPPAPVASVIEELRANQTNAIVVSTDRAALRDLGLAVVRRLDTDGLEGDVWRGLRRAHTVGLVAPASRPLAASCRELAARLRIGKLVWLDRAVGFAGADGRRLSFVHLAELRELLADPAQSRPELLREVEALLHAGVAAVNVCAPEGFGDEIFTYAGSGTLFTRERYLEVRRLGIDDYDAADDLIRRGVEEGYLAPRPPEALERVLASGFGAFVEGRHLAGIGALLVYPGGKLGEVASLYTLTRFLGEGVGQQLVAFAVERAVELGLERVFACTTQERVGVFFERNGFRQGDPAALPQERWRDYDAERRERVLCYERAVVPAQGDGIDFRS
jgi:N-acetylglutamate synthase-like GNAT family acetyltransferase